MILIASFCIVSRRFRCVSASVIRPKPYSIFDRTSVWYRSNSILWLIPLAATALIACRPFLALEMVLVVCSLKDSVSGISSFTALLFSEHHKAAAFPECSFPLLSSHHPSILFNSAWALSAISYLTFPRLLVETSSAKLRVLPGPSNWLDVIPAV